MNQLALLAAVDADRYNRGLSIFQWGIHLMGFSVGETSWRRPDGSGYWQVDASDDKHTTWPRATRSGRRGSWLAGWCGRWSWSPVRSRPSPCIATISGYGFARPRT